MTKQKNGKEVLSLEEALRMEIFISQALMTILVEKGITTQEEIMEKIAALRTSSKIEIANSATTPN
jgi:hypothetical protein